MQPRLDRIQISDGGVPKHAVDSVEVTRERLVGDRQAHPGIHGGPERAVCLLGTDVLDRLRAEGHPIAPGAAGENLLIRGVAWGEVVPGTRFRFEGGVELEARSFAAPCRTIAKAFRDGAFARMDADVHPGDARVYARVLVPGRLRTGEAVELTPPLDR